MLSEFYSGWEPCQVVKLLVRRITASGQHTAYVMRLADERAVGS